MRPAAPITAIRRIFTSLQVAEEALHAIEEASSFRRMGVIPLQRTAELFEQFSLTTPQVDRRLHHNAAHQVTRTTTTGNDGSYLFADLPAGRIRYAERPGMGAGLPVLLIHGFGANGLASWKAPMLDLVRDHRVLVPDLLWFGDSVSGRTPSLDAQADALQALLAARGVDFLDAPVSGGEPKAIDGTLAIMVGGDAKAFETVNLFRIIR